MLAALYGFRAVGGELTTVQNQSADSVPRYGIFELSLRHNSRYDNKFVDVTVVSIFTAPSGSQRTVPGFYYSGDTWKVRFSPNEPGHWTYTYSMSGKAGLHQQGSGAFECLPSNLRGPVRRNPDNPYRWVFDNGTPTMRPYFPIGLQDCIRMRGSRLAPMAIDGGERRGSGRPVSLDEYFEIYGKAGFNLFRFSQRNCSYSLFDGQDHYRETEAMATDELLALARKHDFHVMFGLFGSYDIGSHREGFLNHMRRLTSRWFGGQDERLSVPEGARLMQQRRFVDYCVARWGVYVDFWELLNERHVSDEWTSEMAEYVRAVDPDRKPISTSWEKPQLPAIDINAPHWYESESDLDSDRRVQQMAAKWKTAGKPVIVGEQGNTGMNWDPLSASRMRIRTWTALFEEVSFVFWNTSWSKTGMNKGRYAPGAVANIYLGPAERGYIQGLRAFASRLDAGVRMAPVEISSPERVRAYGLLSKHVAAAYLHHMEEHITAVRRLTITLEVPTVTDSPFGFVAEWIEPSSGALVASVPVHGGRPTLEVPPFTVDLALLVTETAVREQPRPPESTRSGPNEPS
jgi:hypothetical protein